MQATCNRVVVIDKGKVIAMDTLDGIATRMQANARLILSLRKQPNEVVSKIQSLTGVLKVDVSGDTTTNEYFLGIECSKGTDIREEVAEICVHSKLGLLGLKQERLSLEDAFVKLITKEAHHE